MINGNYTFSLFTNLLLDTSGTDDVDGICSSMRLLQKYSVELNLSCNQKLLFVLSTIYKPFSSDDIKLF